MNIDITEIAQGLVNELAADESAARLKTKGVVALYERIQRAIEASKQAATEVGNSDSGPKAEKAADVPEVQPDAGSASS